MIPLKLKLLLQIICLSCKKGFINSKVILMKSTLQLRTDSLDGMRHPQTPAELPSTVKFTKQTKPLSFSTRNAAP